MLGETAEGKRHGRGVTPLAVAAVAALLLLAAFVGLTLISADRWADDRKAWEEALDADGLLDRLPAIATNDEALELERLARTVGIDLAPRTAGRPERPRAILDSDHDRATRQIPEHFRRTLGRPDAEIDPLPANLAAFLDAQRAPLAAIRRHLIGSDLVRWERRLEARHAAPVPNLLGVLELQRLLLADALHRALGRERDAVHESLEASWRLQLAVRDEPLLVQQRIAIAVARMQAGVLRKLGRMPDAWLSRLDEHDLRAAFVTALRFEGWTTARLGDAPASRAGAGSLLRALGTVVGP